MTMFRILNRFLLDNLCFFDKVNHCVFVDECGYNIRTARTQGRARAGERAYRQVCGQRGRNVTVALAVSPTTGLVFNLAIIGGMNAERFSSFLAQAKMNLDADENIIFMPPTITLLILGQIRVGRFYE